MDTLRARFGPLPVWIWLALITALGLAYYIIQRRRNPAPATSTADAAGTGQVPQIVEQTSTTTNVTVPPEAPEPSAPVPLPPVPSSNWPGGRQPLPVIRTPGPVPKMSPDNERRERDNPADVREDRGEPGEEGPEPRATHHGQHRHQAPPKRHIPPRQPVVRRPMPPPRRAA